MIAITPSGWFTCDAMKKAAKLSKRKVESSQTKEIAKAKLNQTKEGAKELD